jgi:hypothetical protein
MNMNISTGGPHILLFERDQQLATLLTSELQLAGYTNHTARTAVEVFDAIARYPIKLVLVNLAQAATARREFWVALDAQRRDRKVQVLTFICTNLAGYGSREFEETNHGTIADMEIDGMLGLMSLVDAVRTRVPGTTIDSGGHTMPRMPRVSAQTSSMPSASTNQHATTSPSTASGAENSETKFRSTLATDTSTNISPVQVPPKPSSPTQSQGPYTTSFRPEPSAATQITGQHSAHLPATSLPGSSQPSYGDKQPSYSEKIRAVLYPNQRSWNPQNSDTYPTINNQQEMNIPQPQAPVEPQTYSQTDTPPQSQPPAQIQPQAFTHTAHNTLPATPQFTTNNVLQRMATGQLSETSGESGLAQLSRMAQGFRPYVPAPNDQPSQNIPHTSAQHSQSLQNTQYGSTPNSPLIQPTQPTQSNNPWALPAGASYASLEIDETVEPFVNITQASPVNPAEDISFNPQTLRASPIQDMPIKRTITGSAVGESNKRQDNRADTYARTTYTAQAASTTSQQAAPASNASPLASIANPMPASEPAPAQTQTTRLTHKTETPTQAKESTSTSKEVQQQEAIEYIKEKAQQNRKATKQESAMHSLMEEELADLEENLASDNAVLLDIVQSLPPMPALNQQQRQSVQPQVLNGRATRSLNKVLLDGHLVPEDRLDVAQSIQRMLRGVDLNYQLGEILLMFKLLTPDQLLAASLVSFGMINTTQISSLGRIRQELHSIGLEYDLENLLVLFRILTPEQLREVRSSLQG